MATQFITNNKGEKTAVVLSLEEYGDLLTQKSPSELTEDYKAMMDEMLEEEEKGTAEYISYKTVKERFLSR